VRLHVESEVSGEDVNTRNPIVWFFVGCFFGSLFILGWLLFPFLPILVLGAVISGISYPLYSAIRKVPKLSPAAASFITCFLIFLVLFVPTVIFVGSLAQQALELYQTARGTAFSEQINALLRDSRLLERVNNILADYSYAVTGDEIRNAVTEIAKFVGLFLYEQARAIASNTLAFVINFFMMILVIFFLLLDGKRLVSYIVDLSPLPSEQEQKLIGRFKQMTGAILIVNGLSGLIQGVLGGLAFWIFGFNSAFLWGVVMALLAFIPIFGIGAIFVPTAVYLFVNGRISAGIFFLVFYIVVTGVTEYVFKPKFVGRQVNIHPLLIFFAIIGGLKLFGILGIIYGPLVVMTFLTLSDIYLANYQRLVESGEH
jgi:predicted PurR-regulated permease PerM